MLQRSLQYQINATSTRLTRQLAKTYQYAFAAMVVALLGSQNALVQAAPTPAPQAQGAVHDLTSSTARDAVVQARDHLTKKRWSELANLTLAAQDDALLGAYPSYWYLRQQVHDSKTVLPTAALRQFLQHYPEHYLAERLKGDWSIAAARNGDFSTVIKLDAADLGNAQTRCAQHYAKHMVQQPVDVEKALQQFAPVTACWTMLDQFYTDQVVSRDDILQLKRAAIEGAKAGEARRLAAIIYSPAEMRDYTSLMAAPRKWLDQQPTVRNTAHEELVTLALSRLGRENDRAAQAQYIQQRWQNQLSEPNLHWVWGQFGLVAALRVEPDAARWYRLSGATPMSDYNHAWEVRAELREPDINWARVQQSIQKMSARQAAEPVWVYWKGRALQAQGQTAAATQAFESITGDLNFYGQLALEELGRLPTLPPAPSPLTETDIADAQSRPGIRRALALFELGWRAEAVSEWAYALRGMSDRQLRATAEVARRAGVYDRVVNTSLLTKQEVDFSQRFIAPFEGKVTAQAQAINLDPAWVYGLIRQESRFITDARSGVGASGLMQLMPDTAKWVANKIGMSDFHPSRVNEFDTNTVLGTHYLNMVLQQLDGSEVLASAGYNAGPRRPLNWRARMAAPMEGAIFAETIPFTETRLYVKNVLSNATYYAMMFSQQPQSLKKRLGTIQMSDRLTASTP